MEESKALNATAPVFDPMTAVAANPRSVEAFKAAMDAVMRKSQAAKAKQKRKKFEHQQHMSRQIKRAQRYLGLRPKRVTDDPLVPGLIEDRATLPLQAMDVDLVVPYPFDLDVVIISVDIEAFERNHSIITEIGIATLDTRDLHTVSPGTNGKEWFALIRARHFLIKEYTHLVNTAFVHGCPDKFDFGKSEIIALGDAPKAVADCFKPPFSSPAPQASTATSSTEEPKRNIILLGHDPNQDIAYLQKLGYNPLNLSTLVEVLDTGVIYRALAREPSTRSLGHILYELDIAGWNLHNAGNDATYTLQALLAMSVRHACETGDEGAVADRIERRVEAAKAAAEQKVREAAEGWSGDASDDGGVALRPSLAAAAAAPKDRGGHMGESGGQGGKSGKGTKKGMAKGKGKSRSKAKTEAKGGEVDEVSEQLAGVLLTSSGNVLDV